MAFAPSPTFTWILPFLCIRGDSLASCFECLALVQPFGLASPAVFLGASCQFALPRAPRVSPSPSSRGTYNSGSRFAHLSHRKHYEASHGWRVPIYTSSLVCLRPFRGVGRGSESGLAAVHCLGSYRDGLSGRDRESRGAREHRSFRKRVSRVHGAYAHVHSVRLVSLIDA